MPRRLGVLLAAAARLLGRWVVGRRRSTRTTALDGWADDVAPDDLAG